MTGDACCAPSAGRTGGEASPPFVAQGAVFFAGAETVFGFAFGERKSVLLLPKS